MFSFNKIAEVYVCFVFSRQPSKRSNWSMRVFRQRWELLLLIMLSIDSKMYIRKHLGHVFYSLRHGFCDRVEQGFILGFHHHTDQWLSARFANKKTSLALQ